jgi:hypothetical protein
VRKANISLTRAMRCPDRGKKLVRGSFQADPGIDPGARHRQAVTGAIGIAGLDFAKPGTGAARQTLDRVAVIAAARQGIGGGEGSTQPKDRPLS